MNINVPNKPIKVNLKPLKELTVMDNLDTIRIASLVVHIKKELNMSVSRLVHREIIKIPSKSTIQEAGSIMRDRKIGSVFVEIEGKVVGIVTDSDLVRKVFPTSMALDTSVELVMTHPLIDVDIEKSAMDANHLMYFNQIRHLAVTENGEVIGMISVRDIVRFFLSVVKGPMEDAEDVIKPLTALTHRDVKTINASATVSQAAHKMTSEKIGCLFVMQEEVFTGIVTEADLVRKVIGYGLKASDVPVGVIMNTPIIDIDINASVQDATELMETKGIRHLGVSEGGEIIGVLSVRDLIGMIAVRDLPRFFSE